MKYKLLLPLPGVPAGGVYEDVNEGYLFFGNDLCVGQCHFAKDYPDFFEPVRWKPIVGDEFYYVTTAGEIGRSTWVGCIGDHKMLEFGNCYESEILAAEARDEIKKLLRGLK